MAGVDPSLWKAACFSWFWGWSLKFSGQEVREKRWTRSGAGTSWNPHRPLPVSKLPTWTTAWGILREGWCPLSGSGTHTWPRRQGNYGRQEQGELRAAVPAIQMPADVTAMPHALPRPSEHKEHGCTLTLPSKSCMKTHLPAHAD